MAFKDLTKVMYDGKIKIDYKDKAHRYYARPRVNWDLPEDDPKAWGKIMYPKGVTTLIGDTLEKKGLMTWPMGLALSELFGFYDFTNDKGEKLCGFSKDKGTLWAGNELVMGSVATKEALLPLIQSASKAWCRRQQKGADIGTIVHDAIEHFIKGEDFDIEEQYMWNIKEAFPLPLKPGDKDEFEAERNRAFDEAPLDVKMATQAFLRFQKWWLTCRPVLHGAEDLLYSLKYNICGTFDADISIPRECHPVFSRPTEELKVMWASTYEKVKQSGYVRCTTDWKTSNASTSESAAMPEGVNYQYFVQSALYEMMRREMGLEPCDDLLIVSARKDGGFSLVYASELDLTVEECIDWAKATITCYNLADKTKKGLVAHASPKVNASKEAF